MFHIFQRNGEFQESLKFYVRLQNFDFIALLTSHTDCISLCPFIQQVFIVIVLWGYNYRGSNGGLL